MQLSDIPHVGLDALMGLRVTALEPDRVTGSLEVTPDLLDGSGTLHRGVISSVVESLASIAGAAWFAGRGHVVGVSNTTAHFTAVGAGVVTGVAEPVDRRSTRQVWVVSLTDQDGQLVSQGTVHLSNLADHGRLAR